MPPLPSLPTAYPSPRLTVVVVGPGRLFVTWDHVAEDAAQQWVVRALGRDGGSLAVRVLDPDVQEVMLREGSDGVAHVSLARKEAAGETILASVVLPRRDPGQVEDEHDLPSWEEGVLLQEGSLGASGAGLLEA